MAGHPPIALHVQVREMVRSPEPARPVPTSRLFSRYAGRLRVPRTPCSDHHLLPVAQRTDGRSPAPAGSDRVDGADAVPASVEAAGSAPRERDAMSPAQMRQELISIRVLLSV